MQIEISQSIIPSIAGLYSDTNRIFMEYIDNSIDSAEEFFDESTNSYKKDIEINFHIDRNSVSFTDNCVGITNFTKVVKSVGHSDKRDLPWTNGQFGFGIYSFLAACDEIEIRTKLKEQDEAQKIIINQKKVFKQNQEIADPSYTEINSDSGTVVILSKFDKVMWKSIDFDKLVNEVEKHFELLLKRKNLTITISSLSLGKNHICEAFDYEAYAGEPWEETKDKLVFKGKGKAIPVTVFPENPVYIYLKLLDDRVINKPPVFIAKGRRIGEIKDIKQFDSKFKGEIWSNPKLTGYIDVSHFLEPDISRTSFRNNTNSKALWDELKEIEVMILEFLSDLNKRSETADYRKLESILNAELSKLAKLDLMNYRTQNLSGKDINVEPGGPGESQEEGAGSEHHRDGENTGNDHSNNNEDPNGFGPSEQEGENPSDKANNDSGASNEETFADTGFTAQPRKRSGFDIKFVDGDPDEKGDTGVLIRSQLVGGMIRIWCEHPDFVDRLSWSRTREKIITQRLVTYIAGEITVHYKDQMQSRFGQAEYNIEMFRDLIDWMYKFEQGISKMSGMKFSELQGL
jgi:hypothetical protein